MDNRGVVFTSYYGDLGGGELRLLEHLALTRLPQPLMSAVVFEPGPLPGKIRELGIPVTEIPWSLAAPRPGKWVSTAVAALRLAKHLRSVRAGLVFCNTFNDLVLAARVARAVSVPVIWRSHADVFPYLAEVPPRRRRAVVGLIDRSVDRALTTTEYDRDLIVTAGVDPAKVHVVRLGVDLEAFAGAAEAGRELRRSFGLPPGESVIGFVARMVPQKGHLVFLDAFARVVRERPRVRALVVGEPVADGHDPDGFRETIRQHAARLGLSAAVMFVGFRHDIPAVMNAVDLFVHASLKEPFGSVLAEAMAAGKPVIASRTRGPLELISDGETGILTPIGDADALAAAILKVLDDRGLAQRLGRNGRAHVAARYDLRDTAALMDRHLLDELGAGGRAQAPALSGRIAG